jgi:hypothetical protein
MTNPASSVVQVAWRMNAQVFHRQYFIDNNVVGIPDNSSLGFSLSARATSQRLGQLDIWPMLPSESGVYTCEVVMLMNNHGETQVIRHSTIVLVSEYGLQSLFECTTLICLSGGNDDQLGIDWSVRRRPLDHSTFDHCWSLPCPYLQSTET